MVGLAPRGALDVTGRKMVLDRGGDRGHPDASVHGEAEGRASHVTSAWHNKAANLDFAFP